MKRFLMYVICMSLCLGMAGCGNAGAEVPNKSDIAENIAQEKPVEDMVKESLEPDVPVEEDGKEAENSTEEAVADKAVTEEIQFSEDIYDYDSMADMLEEYGIRFGLAMSADTAQDYTLQALTAQHFNSVTATNEMKAYSMLDQKASQNSPDGMPVIDFTKADAIVEVAMNNGAQVRGHVLVWDAYMSKWFFCEGYKNNAPYVDRVTMLKRLESYITQVITHFEEKYPGVVYCWDVVNEAVGDSVSDYSEADDRHVRIKRNGEDNLFYTVIGEDYVEISFLYAKNVVEALQANNPEVDIKLFYNDYSTFHTKKRDAICNLVESINSYAMDADGNYRKLCDGVGMQGYIGGYGTQSGCMDFNDIERITTAIECFAQLGVEVHITEMAVRNYSNSLDDTNKHALFYKNLMKALVEVNNGEQKPLTCIAIWGLTDMGYIDESSYSYRQNGPYCGLFTPGYYVKDAFHDVYVMLKEKSVE